MKKNIEEKKESPTGSLLSKMKKGIAEPASKEWFAKHGNPRSKALSKYKDSGTIINTLSERN